MDRISIIALLQLLVLVRLSAANNLYIVEAGVKDRPLQIHVPDSAALCSSSFSLKGFSIVCDIPNVPSVTFFVNGVEVYTDAIAPFAINGDVNGIFNRWDEHPLGNTRIECKAGDATKSVVINFGCHAERTSSTLPSPSSSSSISSTMSTTPSSSFSSPTVTPSTSLLRQIESDALSPPAPTITASISPTATSTSTATATITATPTHTRKMNVKVVFTRTTPNYPISVFEASGGTLTMNGVKYLTVFGGFESFPFTTSAVYRIPFDNRPEQWEQMANLPFPVTHMAQAISGSIFYAVGGFMGKHPARSTTVAFLYNAVDDQYRDLPNLPQYLGGGGLAVYSHDGTRMLVYSGGTYRPNDSLEEHYDSGKTWTLRLDPNGDVVPNTLWQPAEDMPGPRNHMAAVNACGRLLFIGGQSEENEESGNSALVSEFLPDSRTWSNNPPPPLPMPLGHVPSSTMVWTCGVLIVGGITNSRTRVNSVLYWHPDRNVWREVGGYPVNIQTPVCGISGNDILCVAGSTKVILNSVFAGRISTE